MGALVDTHRRLQTESGKDLPDPAVAPGGSGELAMGCRMAVREAEAPQCRQDQPPADYEQKTGGQPAGLGVECEADASKSQHQANQSGPQVLEVVPMPKHLAGMGESALPSYAALNPDFAEKPHVHRVAFLLISSGFKVVDEGEIRQRWMVFRSVVKVCHGVALLGWYPHSSSWDNRKQICPSSRSIAAQWI